MGGLPLFLLTLKEVGNKTMEMIPLLLRLRRELIKEIEKR